MQVNHYDTNTDEQLLRTGLQRGEEAAFSCIYDRYFDMVYTIAYKILGTSEGAEDAVQETFMALWKYREKLEIHNLGGYLTLCIRRDALRAYKKRMIDIEFFERLAKASNEILSADPMVYKELQAKLVSLINALPDDQQLIYNLKREQRMSNLEIAERMNISVKTVEKKMTLSLKYLRTELMKAMVVILASQIH